MASADLIVAATGSWSAESMLNRWHLGQARTKPILYGWTEAHACAGHAVAIAPDGGCLQCGIGRTGVPEFRVVDWPDGGVGNQEEPACGAHYNPYGPVELNYVTAMIGDAALDCLLSPPRESFNRILVAGRRIEDMGGQWSAEWLAEQGDDHPSCGVRTVDRAWLRTTCRACGHWPPAEA